MDNSKKDGYVAGGIFIFLTFVILASSWNQIFSGDKPMIVIALACAILGIGCFVKPEFAEGVVHWLRGLQTSGNTKISQHQHKPKGSPQVGKINGNVTINYGKI